MRKLFNDLTEEEKLIVYERNPKLQKIVAEHYEQDVVIGNLQYNADKSIKANNFNLILKDFFLKVFISRIDNDCYTYDEDYILRKEYVMIEYYN